MAGYGVFSCVKGGVMSNTVANGILNSIVKVKYKFLAKALIQQISCKQNIKQGYAIKKLHKAFCVIRMA